MEDAINRQQQQLSIVTLLTDKNMDKIIGMRESGSSQLWLYEIFIFKIN